MAETSKKRTVRIPLDYYKRPDRLAPWKLGLSAAALLLATGWAFGLNWDFWNASRREERSRRLASHGPLARSHASWDTQCEACHVPFRPIGHETWAAPILGDSGRSDAQCKHCHAGPVHHASQDPQDLACASCHHDHQGRDASLVRIADQQCTQCHSELDAHIKAGSVPIVAGKVTQFDADPKHHPDFRAIRGDDPGNLKFDHVRHLTAGMASSTGGPVQSLTMLREPDRARYRGYSQGAEDTIQLDCAACHQLDQNPFVSPARSKTSRVNGSYMLPIIYENQCRACHPLDFDPANPSFTMSHPLQPAEVHKSLWETYSAQYLSENPALLDQPIRPRPMPGRAESPEIKAAREVIENKVGNAEKLLFGAKKCGECHHYETADRLPVASMDHWNPEHEVQIKPTNVPEVWFRSAAFDHSAHRAVNCRDCHERAYRDSPRASHESRDVLIPSMKVCLECHGPGRRVDSNTRQGGAGSDCTECHRYHNGDAALLGLDSASRGAETRTTIRQFLLGNPTTSRP